MLVTKKLCPAVIAATLMVLACSDAVAFEHTARHNDLGAGPIIINVTPCLLAKALKDRPPCPEPAVLDDGEVAKRVQRRLDRAWYFIDLQQLDKARDEADAALAIAPNNVDARLLAGRLSLSLHDLARAAQDIALAARLAPDDPDVKATQAFMLESHSTQIEALNEYAAILQKHPHHLFSRKESALLLMRLGNYRAAIADLDFVASDREDDNGVLVLRAKAYMAVGEPLAAARDLNDALKVTPGRIDLIAAQADAYAAAGAVASAVKDYDELLATTRGAPLHAMPDDKRAKLLVKRALSYVRLQKFAQAAADMTTSLAVGGKPAILRTEVLLRSQGYAQVPVDGRRSEVLQEALESCFARQKCFEVVVLNSHLADWRR